jgi:diguanylate cyclase
MNRKSGSGSGLKLRQKRGGGRFFILFSITTVILMFCIYQSTSAAQNNQPVLVLTAQKQEYLLGTYFEYLEDPKGELTFEQIRSSQYDSKFITGKQDILNFGMTDSVYWLRFRVRNDAPVTTKWQLELARPTINTIIIYIPEETDSQYVEKKTGFVHPFATREVQNESFLFNLPIETGSEKLIYISVKDKVMDLPFRIWEIETLHERSQTNYMLMGLSFGALIIMFISNLLLTIMLWDKSYLYYSIFQISMIFCLAVLQGYTSRYLWPEQTQINTIIVPLLVEFGLIGLLLFAGTFLQINEQTRAWRVPYQILLTTIVLSTIPTPFIGAKILDVILPMGLLVFIFAPMLAVRAWLNGYREARFYLLSWTVFLITGFSVILERMGLFTIAKLIPEQALQFSCIYIVAFQSLALADRFNLFKQETINAQTALMEQQQKALKLTEALTQTLERARDGLEEKVLERTQALTEVNERLANEVRERERAQKEAELLARVDPLTGLFNRRHFSQLVELEFKSALRYKRPLSILIFDIDQFKKVNDTYGHQVGDKALVHVAEIFQQQARSSDILARYGGEEFIALLPETDSAAAQYSAERLRETLQDSPAQAGKQSIPLTISIGIAGMEIYNGLEDFEELLKEADEALYQAKNSGRNKVIVFEKKRIKR